MKTIEDFPRVFHKSSTLAFPKTTDYACPLEIYNKPKDYLPWALTVVAAVCYLLYCFV